MGDGIPIIAPGRVVLMFHPPSKFQYFQTLVFTMEHWWDITVEGLIKSRSNFMASVGLWSQGWCVPRFRAVRVPGFGAHCFCYLSLCGFTVNQIKLETGLRPTSAGILYTVLLRIEAIGYWVSNSWASTV